MNSCDHQPLQKDLPEAIRLANELYPDYEFKHSNFEEFIKVVKANLPEDLQTVTGELCNHRTNGWSTLVNTASARIYLKQANVPIHSEKSPRIIKWLCSCARNLRKY